MAEKKDYWDNRHEAAILEYLSPETPGRRKNELFRDVINPAFLELIEGISQMPKFHTLYYITKEQLKDFGYEKIIECLPQYNPNRIGKNGYPVKAYSYFGTVAKNAMIFINKKARKTGQFFVYEFDISYQERKDPGTFELDPLIEELNLRLSRLLESEEYKLEDEEVYFFYELKNVLLRWNEIEFSKDKNGVEKLTLKEFKTYLETELNIPRTKINLYFQKLQEFNKTC